MTTMPAMRMTRRNRGAALTDGGVSMDRHESAPVIAEVSTARPDRAFPDDRPDICTPCLEDQHDGCLGGCRCNSSYH
jgi:hypothetical protein